MTSVALFSQEAKDVTKFLGIPVDGYKSEMIRKLKAKGFTDSKLLDGGLEGEFNGTEVVVDIVTNNNKVRRICLIDKNDMSESQIRLRFNNLCDQFENNPKYTPPYLYSNERISENEDISYEISVNDKQYEAAFFQNGDPNKCVWFKIREVYGEFRIAMFYDNKLNEANGEDL